ncbi:hypothetical protein AOLI_G00041200 [Acnodon oligacanthus]
MPVGWEKPREKLYNSTGRELRRALFSLKQIFQDDKDLVHEFVVAEGLTCLIKVGAEADQNYQNYILREDTARGLASQALVPNKQSLAVAALSQEEGQQCPRAERAGEVLRQSGRSGQLMSAADLPLPQRGWGTPSSSGTAPESREPTHQPTLRSRLD